MNTHARTTWGLLLLGSLLAAQSRGQDWKLSGDVYVTEGDYGTDQTYEDVYIPVSIKRYWDAGAAALTVPFVSYSGGDSASGLGDLLLKGWYYALDQREHQPAVDLVARVKVPTASESDGLGTGEPDVGLGVETSYWFSRAWAGFCDLSYIVVGEPAGRDFDNQLIGDVGAGYWAHPWWHAAFLEYRSAVSADANDAVTLLYVPSYRLRPDVELRGSIELGLTDGAPDFGISAGAARWF
ncbi:MAG: transporter [Lentisphaerae bacterium]|nr:transporter [Lentisphaerota bacterium]